MNQTQKEPIHTFREPRRPLSQGSLLILSFSLLILFAQDVSAAPPNVLFIAIDDLNDWLGCLNGHPQAKTPNIDRLAQRGVLFTHAHCAAPLCNPSRAAVFSGKHPFETGVYANDESNIRTLRPDLVLIPQHFKAAGYRTFGAGKLLHQTSRGLFDEEFFPDLRWGPLEPQQVEYTAEEIPSKGTDNPRHVTQFKGHSIVLPLNRMPSDRAPTTKAGESFDWGPFPAEDADLGDGQIADWAAERLRRPHDAPFFLGIGFYRPHIPLFAPQKYFDLFADAQIQLPPILENDLADLSDTAKTRATEAETAGAHATVIKHQQWQAAIKAYLACIAFVDAQVGKLLDALDAGPSNANTIIVLWGDHGWHLGEKQHWGKWTGWQRSTHVPLIVAPPKNAQNRRGLAHFAQPMGQKVPAEHNVPVPFSADGSGTGPKDDGYQLGAKCPAPTSLLDLYPTLLNLCGLPPREGLSGQSLLPLMRDPNQKSNRAILTTFDLGNYSVMGQQWHYIRYADGAEELYDLNSDPHEWHNLTRDRNHKATLQALAKQLPTTTTTRPTPTKARKTKKGKAE